MNNRFQMNIYFKRNNRACMVFKRNGLLYRINNLMQANEFVQEMKEISGSVAKDPGGHNHLELKDHRAKIWVLECIHDEDIVTVNLWFQSKSSGEYLDVRFSWKGTEDEFLTAVHFLSAAADVQRIFRLYKKD